MADMVNYPVAPDSWTNYDRVRNMSDEELAEFLDETQRMECEAIHELSKDGSMKFQSAKTGWLIWLRQSCQRESG